MAIKKSGKANNNGINYEVLEKCGVISENKGYTTELRYISWNGNEGRYDLRTWHIKDGIEQCGKGITLTGEQLEKLGEIIKGMEE